MKYTEYDLHTLQVQVETLETAFKQGRLSTDQQKGYLLMKAEIKRRQQAKIDFTNQPKLF